MKIIINAYQYASYITGTDRMASNFLNELQKIDRNNSYYIVCSSEGYIPSIINSPNFKIIRPLKIGSSRFINKALSKGWRVFLSLRLLPLRADVYFSFHNMRLPRLRIAKRMIASNLDLIPIKLEEYEDIEPSIVREIKRVAKKADAFMSISNFSKNELSDSLGVNPDNIKVIHLAADPSFSRANINHKFADSLPNKFIFTIGGSEPRKNVITVSRAHKLLPESIQEEYPLLIVGGSWHGIPLKTLQLSKHIKTLGYVSEEELATLYRQASAFVFASKYEGFGFTVLEAMASKTPVISAKSSSLEEVCGNAAALFKTDSSKELALQLNKVLKDKGFRAGLINKGSEQANKFQWERSAIELKELLTSR